MVDIPFVGRGPDVVRAQVVMPVDGEGLPAFGAQAAPNRNTVSDDNLVQSAGTTNGTAGVWQEVLPANVNRQGATIANRNASGNVFIVQAATQPAAGQVAGDMQIGPGLQYRFDFVPKKRYWIRADAASLAYSVWQW